MINTPVLKKQMRGKSPQIAKLLGIAESSLSRKVNNRQAMTVNELVKIAHYLDIDIRKIIKKPDDE
jgi:transcriptional regulator with XRE-family HTH domain